MFALPTSVGSAQRVVAMLVATAVVLSSIGVYVKAEAANVLEFSDLLSDSAPGVVSNHQFDFITPTGVTSTESIILTFPTSPDSFDLTSIVAGDVDLEVDGVDETIGAGAGEWTFSSDATSITLTSNDGAATIPANGTTTIKVGTNADGGANQIVNPTTSNTSYEILVTAGASDGGATRVAIVDTVTVTAQVPTIFDFTVTGLATSTAVNGTSTTGLTTATTIPFGDVTQDIIETLAQRLNVTTNARNGFVVTVEQDQNLLSSTGADIDGFIDGAYTNTPAAWQAPAETLGTEDTYGHWGLTSSDDLNTDEFGSNLWVAASTTPREIFTHDGPADGSTDNIGSTTVGYQVEITGLQEAGDDYTTTLTYIATPTF